MRSFTFRFGLFFVFTSLCFTLARNGIVPFANNHKTHAAEILYLCAAVLAWRDSRWDSNLIWKNNWTDKLQAFVVYIVALLSLGLTVFNLELNDLARIGIITLCVFAVLPFGFKPDNRDRAFQDSVLLMMICTAVGYTLDFGLVRYWWQ